MERVDALHDCYFLLDAKTEGRIITLRFLHAQTGETLEKKDSGYNPYFFLPHPLSKTDNEKIRGLYKGLQVVKKRDLFTDQLKDLTKVMVYAPETLRKTSKTLKNARETEIEYTQSYVYDNNLVFGAPYKITKNEPVLVANISKKLQNKFEDAFSDIRTAKPQKYAQIKYWFNLLNQPVPQLKPKQLGVETPTPEDFLKAFMLARIANISVPKAIQSRRVSDWLKSINYAYLRKSNILIPSSKELRKGLETYRVQGALTVTPKAGVYFNTVVCDFESLYPSIIDSYNLSYETVNCAHDECKTNKINECPQHCVCTKRKGFYSVLVGALKDLRIHWFKPLSKNTAISKDERKTAQVIAELLKLISVSSYGVTVRIHGLACPPLAECITGYGRWALQTTWNIAEKNGLQPIYGDTDSIFLDNPEHTQVEYLIKTVKERLKLDLAIEKKYSLCVLPEAKKAYFGILPNGKPDIKGLTAIKSNSPNFIQKVFQNCVRELSKVKSLKEYESAKKRIIAIVQQAVKDLRNHKVQLEELVYSVRLYFDPKERSTTKTKVTPQQYQSAFQLLDSGIEVGRGDTVQFIKVKPFSYGNKVFTVKPVEHVKSVKEINAEDYVRNMSTALEQTFAPMGIKLKKKPETKITDWFNN